MRNRFLKSLTVTGFYLTLLAAQDFTSRARVQQFSAWSAPVNLGPVVNSAGDEKRPAISRDGLSLYFSSGLAKRFPVGESKHFDLRAEFFNLFNHVNLANPLSNFNAVSGTGGSINAVADQVVNPGNFGRIISTSSNPRIIQLALKFTF